MRAVFLTTLALGLFLTTQPGAQQRRTPRAQPAPRSQAAPPQPSRPRAESAVPFRVGETLTYDVAWSRYLVAGSAVSRVVEKRPSYNSTAYYIVAEGRPLPLIARIYALYYKMDSLLDSYTALSQRSSVYAEEGASRRLSTTLFNRAAQKAQFEMRADTTVKDEFTVPQNVQDGLATLYSLRGHAFKAGDRVTVPVADEGSLYTASFDVTGPEPVKVPLGEVQAWHLRVTVLNAMREPVGNNIGAWISTDARRLPVKLEAELPVGTFGLTLRTVEHTAASAQD
jgi:hypothetical protein